MEHPSFDFEGACGDIRAYKHTGNGLQVLLYPLRAAPVATFMVTYRVGSRNEVTGLTGATHFLEHLMFKGSARFNAGQGTSVFQVLQRLGAQVNATTWLDRTNYYAMLPSQHLGKAIEIEADRMRGALIAPKAVASEKTVILNELDRGQNDPVRTLYHEVWAAAFAAHPYGHPTIGWRSDVEAVTADKLRSFYDTYYWPNNATASLIGAFDDAEALQLIDDAFSKIPQAPHPIPDVETREPQQRGERRVTLRQSGQIGHLIAGWKIPPALHPDADALSVLSLLLTVGKSSRLHRALTDTSLTTFVSGMVSRLRDPGLFTLVAQVAPGHTHAEVEHALYAAIEQVQQEGVEMSELERALGQLKAQEAFGRDGSFSAASGLNEAIAAGDWRLFATAFERAAQVTASDVQRVAQTYLVEDARTIGFHLAE